MNKGQGHRNLHGCYSAAAFLGIHNLTLPKTSHISKAENHMTLVIMHLYLNSTGKKNVHYFLILNEVSCSKVQLPCLSKQQKKY